MSELVSNIVNFNLKRKLYYAHSRADSPEEAWQPLVEHLKHVAQQAAQFAASFHSAEWAFLCGLLHDLGKYSFAFQKRLHGGKKVDHSLAGAAEVMRYAEDRQRSKALGRLLAHVISGHHTGLADGASNSDGYPSLAERIHKAAELPDYTAWKNEITLPDTPPLPKVAHIADPAFPLFLWGKMLYSCLVDADFLDTEAFMKPERNEKRGSYPALSLLHERLDAHLAEKITSAAKLPINKYRAEVLHDCRNAGVTAQGIFSLTVPTGGGKTLSSLAFAMEHAKKHALRRIIYVIPYTSIIEQTADVFRKAFGKELAHAVVEHHCNVSGQDEPKAPEDADALEDLPTLAWENWDAPIIVTTAVQFFESLFAARSSRCRKLHNITSSVVILDEAQTLPVRFLRPCLSALKELARLYATSIVLCTATQPEVGVKPWLKGGLDTVSEIVQRPDAMFTDLKRVTVERLGKLDDGELTMRLAEQPQVLCIVNTRAHARDLCDALRNKGRDDVFHLSTWMCPAHRKAMLRQVRDRLKDPQKTCRLVATSLIEAGVDISFPVLYRAMNGLDSIHQAAGRCNREGALDAGLVYIFESNSILRGEQSRKASACCTALREVANIFSRRAVGRYFDELYSMEGESGLDKKDILGSIAATAKDGYMPYRSVADAFTMIEKNENAVLIAYDDEAKSCFDRLRKGKTNRELYRRLQHWCVTVPKRQWDEMLRKGIIESIGFAGQWHILNSMDLYDPDYGLDIRDPTFMRVERGIF
ncbi:CRISPR-associated helicase/endonuclease Cas3 [Deltaproteobacteria bacterium]|nr:CRISPR-associated helicase/endonuclease Cas3 [Deltaproteobacteria bacterium]